MGAVIIPMTPEEETMTKLTIDDYLAQIHADTEPPKTKRSGRRPHPAVQALVMKATELYPKWAVLDLGTRKDAEARLGYLRRYGFETAIRGTNIWVRKTDKSQVPAWLARTDNVVERIGEVETHATLDEELPDEEFAIVEDDIEDVYEDEPVAESVYG